MGWIQRMQRARVRKKRRKLEYKIKRSYGSANKTAKYQRKLDDLNAKFPPYGSKTSNPVHNSPAMPVSGFGWELEYRQKELAQQQAMIAQMQNAENSAPTTPKHAVSSTPSQPAAAAAPVKSGPSIPSGNRYAAHEQLISKIAREIVAYCTEVTAPRKWHKGVNSIRVVHNYELKVNSGYIHIRSLHPDPRGYKDIGFNRYDMKNIPDTQAFVDAIFPLADAYFRDRIREQFAHSNVHVKPRIHNRADRGNSVFYLEVQEHHDADNSLNNW